MTVGGHCKESSAEIQNTTQPRRERKNELGNWSTMSESLVFLPGGKSRFLKGLPHLEWLGV